MLLDVLLLNQARLRALEDVDNILKEKETLQREINMLETRLAETDARLKVAAQEKINAELLEDQLQKLKNEISDKDLVKDTGEGLCEIQQTASNNDIPVIDPSSFSSFIEELKVVKEENVSLKYDLEVLKSTLANVRETHERMLKMEEERSSGIALEELELELAAVQENVREITNLKYECKSLSGKVEDLQALVGSASRQAAQTIDILEQNQELSKKLDRLETSIEEAKTYKLSLEQSQQYNKLLEQQVKILEEHLLMSDKEIQSQVSLYRESVNEFHSTLERIKEESDRKKQDEPVDDMPWEFWSHLLLCLDGWLLEKKISNDDAKLLREMAWKRDARIRDVFMSCKDKQEDEAVTAFLKLVSARTCPALHVMHIAAEMAPVAKVGGLGDVVSGLGKALQRRGHLVEIILPKYDCMQYGRIENLKALNVEVESYFDGQLFKNRVWVGIIEGLPVYFIEPQHPAKFFWRGQFYGEHDDFRRFSFFCRAALEFLYRAGKKPDIIHCHDWQTAFIAPLYWDLYAPKGLNSARICFTCHNFEYQGTAPASELTSCGLDATQLNRHDRMQDNVAHHKVNAVKGGIVFSNIVTTVSPTYAEEVRTAEGGHGLHHTLNAHSRKFLGILNGIDTDAWDPATDTLIRFQYTADDLQGKAGNKDALRKYLGLSSADASMPMVGCITRLVPQKGVHLIRHSIYRTVELGGQFLLLGSSPVPHIQREFEDIANHFHGHQNVRLILKYDDVLAHSIYAACDMFVIPSIFEPCGLTQMISMRYGSIPIARRTGGLNDSVFDIDDETIPLQFRNGFTFTTADEQGLSYALDRAFNYYKRSPEKWLQLVKRAMTIDFSWEPSAKQYEELYERSLARARASIRA
ncbi:putative starch synthase 4 [Nymphaea thermarum]|nr:putative starch synthase 4 [Nymphaea thermarum]